MRRGRFKTALLAALFTLALSCAAAGLSGRGAWLGDLLALIAGHAPGGVSHTGALKALWEQASASDILSLIVLLAALICFGCFTAASLWPLARRFMLRPREALPTAGLKAEDLFNFPPPDAGAGGKAPDRKDP